MPSPPTRSTRFAGQRIVWGDVAFIVGADEFADFLDWKDPDGVLEHARLLVASRPGFPQERLDRVLAGLQHPERVELFEIRPLPISSREIRARVANGEPIDDLVPPCGRRADRRARSLPDAERDQAALVAVGIVLALLFAGGAMWAWYRQEDPVETAVREDLLREGQEVDRVSCDRDHTARLGEQSVVFYRCTPHGGPEDGIVQCVAMVGDRFLTPAEAQQLPIGVAACRDQG